MEGILFSSNTTWGSTPEITAFYELIGTKHVLTRETTQPKLYKHVQACSTLQCIVYSKNFQVC